MNHISNVFVFFFFYYIFEVTLLFNYFYNDNIAFDVNILCLEYLVHTSNVEQKAEDEYIEWYR